MDIEFSSQEELYKRLKPALTTKCHEMVVHGYNYIKEEDVWNYLKEIKWKKSTALALSDMVNDILNTDDSIIDNYLKSKLNGRERKIYFEN